jgi:hypothetical protein
MGIFSEEPKETTVKGDTDVGYCHLQLPSPALQTEFVNTNRTVLFYFGAHVITSMNSDCKEVNMEYFICFGDQIGSLVFIFALHAKEDSLPFGFLCLEVEHFQKWQLPIEGEESVEPPSNAWGVHSTLDFLECNMTPGHKLTQHITDKKHFSEKAIGTINHLVKFKNDEAYSFIFKIKDTKAGYNDSSDVEVLVSDDEGEDTKAGYNDSSDVEVLVSDDDGDKNDDEVDRPALTPAQKAAKTRAENKKKGKLRHQAKRSKGDKPPLDVNSMLRGAQQLANEPVKQGQARGSKAVTPKNLKNSPKIKDPPKIKDTPKTKDLSKGKERKGSAAHLKVTHLRILRDV